MSELAVRRAPPPPVARIAPPPPAARIAPPPVNALLRRTCKTLDIECYVNYFLILCLEFDYKTGEVLKKTSYELYGSQYYVDRVPYDNFNEVLELLDTRELKPSAGCPIITFNGIKYDNIMLTAFMNGANTIELKRVNGLVIPETPPGGVRPRSMMPWDFEKKYGLKLASYNHIDLIEVAFGTASLKVYGARLKSRLLQELPIHFNSYLMPFQRDLIFDYCDNDNLITIDLFLDLKPALELRRILSAEYGSDFRSKSDAQIGEAILVIETERMTNKRLRKPNMKTFKRNFKYVPPPFISFTTVQMLEIFNVCQSTEFIVDAKTNKVKLPPVISKIFKMGTGDNAVKYKMGIGGLHSVTSGGTFISDEEWETFEIDVSSFYPNIIILSQFFIEAIGKDAFIQIYQSVLDKKNNASERLKEVDDELARLKAML